MVSTRLNSCPAVAVTAGLAVVAFCAIGAHASDHPGLAVYREHCVRCHGPDGGGTEQMPEPLAGDRSVSQLATLIDETMPEDDPALVTGDAARQVAEYVHAAFYSRMARERNRPPRVELSRLTARQYRNAIVDIFSAGRTTPVDDGRRGLEAKYFDFRRKGGNELVIDRIDPRVDFHFGVEGPDPKISPGRFVIQWTGSIVPPDTGTYEFVVRTDHAAILAVNATLHQPPLIDAAVKSGGPTEVVDYRATTFLLGGRPYPLRLEFKKTAPGVSAFDEAPLAKASITLLWKPPHGPLEPVPEWALRPQTAGWTIFPTTPFPPEDRLTGFERGSSVSQEWYSATTAAAGEITDFCMRNVHVLVAPHDAPDRAAKLRAFAARVATAALRRRLTPELEAAFVDRPFADAGTPDTGLERSLLLVLGSPRFLFREVGGGDDDPFATASRMSFGMWDSLPDDQLLAAAQHKRLATPEQVRQQAERMVKDRRARLKLRDFLASWLRIDIGPEITKNPLAFSDFTAESAADLRTSLWLLIDDVIDGGGDFRRLFMDDQVHLNGRLAPLYGVSLPPDAGFRRVRLDDGRRAGVLSHPYLMSVLAHADTTSPILRGVFLARTVLGNSLKPPQEAIPPLGADLHVSLTTRERVALQTSPVACKSCHSVINPLGFALEEFDAIGRLRATESCGGAAKPIDASGSYVPREGPPARFRGARQLAAFVAASPDAQEAFVQALFEDVVKQPAEAWGADTIPRLRESFAAGSYSIPGLLVDIVTLTAFPPRVGVEVTADRGQSP